MTGFIFGLFIGTALGYFVCLRRNKKDSPQDKDHSLNSRRSIRNSDDEALIYAAPYGDYCIIRIDRDDGVPRVRLDSDEAYEFGRTVIAIANGEPTRERRRSLPQSRSENGKT